MEDSAYGTDFKLLVDKGIERCQTYLKNIFDLNFDLELIQEICAKFSRYIDDFQSDNTEMIRAMYDAGLRIDAQRLLLPNVKKIMYELIAFRSKQLPLQRERPTRCTKKKCLKTTKSVFKHFWRRRRDLNSRAV